jgi:hypothetical protein
MARGKKMREEVKELPTLTLAEIKDNLLKLKPKENGEENAKFWFEKYDQNLTQTSKAYLDKILKSPVHKSEFPNPLNPLNSWNLGM